MRLTSFMTQGRRSVFRAGLALALCGSASAATRAESVADFYKAKQITLIVGSDPGGGYDLLARLVSRHLGQFIPGRPRIIVQNMPGAGSVLMSNQIYRILPEDGSVIGMVQRGILISQVLKLPGVHFKVDKFQWIGSVTSEISVVVSWATSPVKTFQDLLKRQLVVGGTGRTSDTEAAARLLNALAGTKFKIISGYPGTADVMLAMERGEVQGVADLSWSEMKAKHASLLKQHKLNLLAQDSLEKAPDLPNVPRAIHFVKGTVNRQTARLFYTMKEVARPILTGPSVPADRVAALRHAFAAMIKDPGFEADAKKLRLDLTPKGYKAVEKFISLVDDSPPQVTGRLAAALDPP